MWVSLCHGTLTIPHCRFCELAEQHHSKDLLPVEEFLQLRKQVITKPTEPITVACTTDDDDTTDAAVAEDEPPPGVDDQPGSDTSSDNKSKVNMHFEVLSTSCGKSNSSINTATTFFLCRIRFC